MSTTGADERDAFLTFYKRARAGGMSPSDALAEARRGCSYDLGRDDPAGGEELDGREAPAAAPSPSAPTHDDTGAMGLPYARAEFDGAGRYHLVCPACGEKCYPASTTTEADTTRGAKGAYAAHYALMRPRTTA